MRLSDMLFSQGFGTRRVCAGLVQKGCVWLAGQQVWEDDLSSIFVGALSQLQFEVRADAALSGTWQYQKPGQTYALMHKPAGFECSHKPGLHPSVYTLLPLPLRQRPEPLQAVGRLDQDTTGLLLLTDDGKLLHRLASPKHHVPKTYRIQTARPVTAEQIAQLLAGVALHDEQGRARDVVVANRCEQLAEYALDLTIAKGKYHQVKRMIAAVGNHVSTLHRWRYGSFELPDDLPPGHWRWLSAEELQACCAAG